MTLHKCLQKEEGGFWNSSSKGVNESSLKRAGTALFCPDRAILHTLAILQHPPFC